MSRIGRRTIDVPADVQVTVTPGPLIVRRPRGGP